MNDFCRGDWWEDLKLYRCAKHGRFLPLDRSPEVCPHCERSADPYPFDRATFHSEGDQIWSRHRGGWVDFPPELLPNRQEEHGLLTPSPNPVQRIVWEVRWKVLERCDTGRECWTEQSRLVLGGEDGLEVCLKLSAREMGRQWTDPDEGQGWKVVGFSVLALKRVLACVEA